MNAPFEPVQPGESWRSILADALHGGKAPIDRSFTWNFPDYLTQDWIDDLVLQAHTVAPIWSDYALVKERPDVWGIASYIHGEDRFELVADDSLVVASADRVEMLITATPVADSETIHYQIGLHCFTMNSDTILYPMNFRDLAKAYGLLAYPDSTLIDKLGLWQTGKGADAYIAHCERTRPVFILRKQTNLPTGAKRYQRASKFNLQGFGPVVVNDELFNKYRYHLSDRKFGAIAIAPGEKVFPLEREGSMVPTNFRELLECCELTAPSLLSTTESQIYSFALSAWGSAEARALKADELQFGGELLRQSWERIFERFAPPIAESESEARGSGTDTDEAIGSDLCGPPIETAEPLRLDDDGYPVDASDVSRWAETKFAEQIVIPPRARRALTKSQHPDPRRIAETLEILAGPKLRGYLGEADTVAEFEAGLLKLHMRDGFSNAERLKGQTGADYIIEHNGRRLLLERHLRSNSSGFNDPKMIRIYYVFDRLSRKIVVGWLPHHLRTTQS